MTVGVMIASGFNSESITILKQAVGNRDIISNYKLPIDHTFLKLSNKPKTVWGAKEINIPFSDVKMNISDPNIKQIALMLEIAKRSQELLIVFPDKHKINMLMLLIAINLKVPAHVIIGSEAVRDAVVKQWLKTSDLELLRQQYAAMVGITHKQSPYKDEDLIRTPNGAKLRQYQQQMVDFVLKTKRVGLFVDMGLGKTLATLATLAKLAETGEIDTSRPVLIIAPITVALDTWSREAAKWGYDIDVKINIQLTPKKRAQLLDDLVEPQQKLTIVTTNPHQLESMFDYYRSKGVMSPFEMIVVDELSMFKSPTAKRFKVLSEETKFAKYFIGLTGTPAPNNLLDVWSQLILIDSKNKKDFGGNFYVYRDKYFEPAQQSRTGQVFKWKLKPNAEYEIYQRMKKTVISMKSAGLVELPDITYSNLYVKLPAKAMKLYKELDEKVRKKLLVQQNLEIRSSVEIVTDDIELEVSNAAVLSGKLTQLSSGAIYDDFLEDIEMESNETNKSKTRNFKEFHDVKFKALKELVETSTSPILVFFYFQSELARLSKYVDFEYLDPHTKDFNDKITRWNNGEIPVLVAHPASAGHGLNLQEGGHTIVWLTPTWSNEQYRQANKRLHRSGQKNIVSVIHIVAQDTEDENIIARIDEKEENQNDLMTELDVAYRGET